MTDIGSLQDIVTALTDLLTEVRRGQEPITLTQVRHNEAIGDIWIMPRQIVGVQTADGATWIHMAHNYGYFVRETPAQVAEILRGIRWPLT